MGKSRGLHPSVELQLHRNDESFMGSMRFALLEQIHKTGSITKAGKVVGISYRTAWDAVDKINALSDKPLVKSAAGGEKGGGTRLTGHGREMLERYALYRKEHEKFLDALRRGIGEFDRFRLLARKMSLKISARNQVWGKVASIRKSGLRAQVTLRIGNRETLRTEITRAGLDALGLRVGDDAYALIKANWIGIAAGSQSTMDKALNRLKATVVNCSYANGIREAVLSSSGGNPWVCTAEENLAGKRLVAGDKVLVIIHPSDVLIGVPF